MRIYQVNEFSHTLGIPDPWGNHWRGILWFRNFDTLTARLKAAGYVQSESLFAFCKNSDSSSLSDSRHLLVTIINVE